MHETIGYDLVVDEEELQAELERIVSRAVNYEEVLGLYCQLLSAVKEEAIIEGNTAENLRDFCEEVTQLKGELTEIAEQIYRLSVCYHMAIDAADSYLY